MFRSMKLRKFLFFSGLCTHHINSYFTSIRSGNSVFFIQLTIMEYNEYNEKWKQAVEADMIAMLDRLVVAYGFCQIRFDQQHPGHKLSFRGIGKDKTTDIIFDEYYHSVKEARFPQTSRTMVQNYAKLMAEATRFVYRASFNHVWTKLSEDMLYERRSKGNERRSQMEAVRNTVGGVTGKIITTDASGIDAAKLMNLLSNAGLGDVDVNIELVRHGSGDTGDSDEMKEAMEDIIDQHLEQIRAVKKNKKREQAYDHVIDQ
uniref:Phage portal protein n=1 Tax=Heterorhabditis bacteriophora TaxID=37862 RepID=A0A1I7WC42_HETBA